MSGCTLPLIHPDIFWSHLSAMASFRISVTIVLSFIAYVVALNFLREVLPRGTLGRGELASISLAVAVLTGLLLWRVTSTFSEGLILAMSRGAAIAGCLGFVGGFVGPMLLAPSANQGPLLGIFVAGPLGCLLGGVSGAIWWRMRGHAKS